MFQSVFSQINDAKITERTPKFPPGFEGEANPIKLLFKNTEQHGPAFIVEFKVVLSNMAEVPIGQTRSWYQGMARHKQVAMNAILEFAVATLGIKPSQADLIQQLQSGNPSPLQQFLDYATTQSNDKNHFTHEDPAAGQSPLRAVKIRMLERTSKEGRTYHVPTFHVADGTVPAPAPAPAAVPAAVADIPDIPGIPGLPPRP